MSLEMKFNGCKLILDTAIDMDNFIWCVRLGYSGIRMSSGGVTKTLSQKTQTSDLRPQTPKTQTPRIYLKKIYTVNSS